MSDTVLEVRDLTKRYGGGTALNGLSLELEAGRIYALLGEPGSGRTTLLRCIAGLCRPDGGEIALLGHPPAELTKARREVGMLVDAPALYGDLSVVGNLLLQSRALGKVDKKRIGRLMKALAIAPRNTGFRTVGSCPATIKLRLGIAMALLHSPRLLLMDEVYSGLDSDDSNMLNELLAREMGEREMTVLMTGQFFSELYPVATDFLLMNKGRVTARYTKDALAARLPEGISKPAEYEAFYKTLQREAAGE